MRIGLLIGLALACASPAEAGYIGFGCEALPKFEMPEGNEASYLLTYHPGFGAISLLESPERGQSTVFLFSRTRDAAIEFGHRDETFTSEESGTLVLTEASDGVIAHWIALGSAHKFAIPDCDLD